MDDGFQKMDLTKASEENPSSPVSTMPLRTNHKKRKIIFYVTGVVVVLIVLFLIGVVVPGIRLAAQAKKTYAQAKLIATAAKTEDIQKASDQIAATKTELIKTQADLHSMGYLAFVPILSWYYHDADHLINAGFDGLSATNVLVDSIKPYADVLGLKGQGSFVGGSAQQRIQTAVQTFGKVAPNIDKISGYIVAAKKELDMVDPNHYPGIFGGGKVKSSLSSIRTVADQADTFVTQATPLIKVLPSLLGEPSEQKYLVLFQNDKELRPTGGFISAYAIMRLEHGVPHPDSSGDIYTLDATIPNKPVAPRIILDYLPKVPQLNLRDTNISPDFITSMDTFNSLYNRAGGYVKVNGIVALDTYPLVDAINILGGSIDVDGQTFTTKQDPRCDCANVIYELEAASDQPVNYVRTNRKAIIGDLMIAILNKAFASSPKVYWGPLFQAMITDISQKHILFDIYNQDAQSGIEALNAAGRIQPFDGDYLHINDANFGGEKDNLYVTEAVTQNYQVASDGTITKTITIDYKDPNPPSDCNLERGGLCLNSILRDLVRIYVPQGSKLTSSQGSEVKVTSYDELGKTVFEGFITVRPQGAARYTLTYQLPFKLANGSPLPAMYQKQPGTGAFIYTVQVNGAQKQQFPLDTDKTIKVIQ